MSHLFRFRHLWPLKDLTLTTNQVRRWVRYLLQVGGGLSLELGPQSLLSLLSSPPPPYCRGARAALASRCGGRHPAFWVVLISRVGERRPLARREQVQTQAPPLFLAVRPWAGYFARSLGSRLVGVLPAAVLVPPPESVGGGGGPLHTRRWL